MRRQILISMCFVTIIALLFLASQTFADGGPVTLIEKSTTNLVGVASWVSAFPTVTLTISGLSSYNGYYVKFQVLNGSKLITATGTITGGSVIIPLDLPKKIKGISAPGYVSIFVGATEVYADPFMVTWPLQP